MRSQNDNAILSDLHALERCSDLDRLERMLKQFNAFRVLRCEDGEIRHSNMLAWLLNRDESHGLEDMFLRRWLQSVLKDSTSENHVRDFSREIAKCTIRDLEVHREWNHLDLLVKLTTAKGDIWIIAIENKFWSTQTENQLFRYREIVESTYPTAKLIFIYLTKHDDQPEDLEFLSAKHEQVHKVLEACINKRKRMISKGPLTLIRDYLTILEERCMENTRISQLAQKIYKNHTRALELIMKYRTDSNQPLTDALVKRVKASGKRSGIIPMATDIGIIRFLPQKWDTHENRNGHEWGESGSAYVLIELGLVWGPHPWLEVIVSKCPHKKWRREIYDISQHNQFPIDRWNKGVKDDWMRIFAVKCPVKLNGEKVNACDGNAKDIWDWCKKTMKKPDFQKVIRLVTAHLKNLPSHTTGRSS